MSLMMCGLKINKPLCKVHVNCIKCEINKQKDFSFTLLVNHIALMSALQFFKTFYVELSDFIFTFVGQTGSIDSNVFEYVLSVLFEYLFRLFFEKREKDRCWHWDALKSVGEREREREREWVRELERERETKKSFVICIFPKAVIP